METEEHRWRKYPSLVSLTHLKSSMDTIMYQKLKRGRKERF